jgi:hypothetical protein
MPENLPILPITHSPDTELLDHEANYKPSREWAALTAVRDRLGVAFAENDREAIAVVGKQVDAAQKVWLESVRRQ